MDDIKIANMTALELCKQYASGMLSPVTVTEVDAYAYRSNQPKN